MVTRGWKTDSSVRQLGRPQEIVIARRTHLYTAHPVGVHQHVVQIPQVNVRQVFRNDLLDFIVDGLALLLVDGAAALRDQLIHTWVGIKSAIGAFGRKAIGAKDVLENIGIKVASDPAQRMELVRTFGDIGEERRKLKTADVELDARLSQLLLQQNAVRGLRLVAQQVMNDWLHVDGICNRVANPNVFQDWIAQIHREIRVD